MNINRINELKAFYSILSKLESKVNGCRMLSECSGRMDWPTRGIYFFMEHGEIRNETGSDLRVVRVGTHALKQGSKTKLWNRLSQHKGNVSNGGGNHRGSIFRLLMGTALIEKNKLNYSTWGQGNTAKREIREKELVLEVQVSESIRAMPFLWLAIEDESGPDSLRGYIERNSIALLSNYNQSPIDAPSESWLGHQCNRERVRLSGLWNQNHVDENYDPGFLKILGRLVSEMDTQL